MGAGRTLGRMAALAAAIGGVIFFWRKRHEGQADPTSPPTPPTASDTP
jgi:hypothetical protein